MDRELFDVQPQPGNVMFRHVHTAGEQLRNRQQLDAAQGADKILHRCPHGISNTMLGYHNERIVTAVVQSRVYPKLAVTCYSLFWKEAVYADNHHKVTPVWLLKGFCTGNFPEYMGGYEYFPCEVAVTATNDQKEAFCVLIVYYDLNPEIHDRALPYGTHVYP